MAAEVGQQWWRRCEGRTDRLPWEFSEAATRYLAELLTAEPLRVPVNDNEENTVSGDLEVFQLQCSLQRDERTTSSALVLPPSTRGMWREVLEATSNGRSDNRVLVIGTPGVGKSRSMNYFLKLVIDRRRQEHSPSLSLPVIVFEHRKDKVAWLLAPKDPSDRESEYEAFSLSRPCLLKRKWRL